MGSEINQKTKNNKLKAVIDVLSALCCFYFFMIFPLYLMVVPDEANGNMPTLMKWSFGLTAVVPFAAIWILARNSLTLGKKYPFTLSPSFKAWVALTYLLYFYAAYFFLKVK
jgi:hypothetical protein